MASESDQPQHQDLATASYNHDAIISAVASMALRDVITGPWSNMGDLACAALDLQLKLHNEGLKDAEESLKRGTSTSLFEAAASKIAGSIGEESDVDADIRAITSLPPAIVSRAFGEAWELVPYTTLCAIKARQHEEDTAGKLNDDLLATDIDEWLLLNERALRADRKRDWRWGLVKYSIHADIVFKGSHVTPSERVLKRQDMTGQLILDLLRPSTLALQPSLGAFAFAFTTLTDGLLKGLDWDNIFVAGGIVLGALLCTDVKKDAAKYENSDIDLYIYGLGPVEANEKIAHIYEVWQSNLPAGSESRVLRNSRTITFLSTYPIKRIQIVLKLVSSPKEVLLNFDLDPCSMGYDGSELWLLPRAARALETGYSVFTMDLVHGHYLGERRATQQQRVFKYADKGFGIRFLPSYVEHIASLPSEATAALRRKWSLIAWQNSYPINLEAIFDESRRWTLRLLEVSGGDSWRTDRKPFRIAHDELTDRKQNSTDPGGRSILQNLSRFMRHVALWEHAVRGEIILDNTTFAYTDYNDFQGPIGYDEGPHYAWSNVFKFSEFEDILTKCNRDERVQFESNLRELGIELPNSDAFRWGDWHGRLRPGFVPAPEQPAHTLAVQPSTIRRMTLRQTLDEVMGDAGDSLIPLILPEEVVVKCNSLIQAALEEHNLPNSEPPLVPALKQRYMEELEEGAQAEGKVFEVPVFWRINAVRAWQLIDRRIDEAYEILWAFRAANVVMGAEHEERALRLVTQLSKRAIRQTSEDELTSFTVWVTKPPVELHAGSYGAFYEIGAYDSEEEDRNW